MKAKPVQVKAAVKVRKAVAKAKPVKKGAAKPTVITKTTKSVAKPVAKPVSKPARVVKSVPVKSAVKAKSPLVVTKVAVKPGKTPSAKVGKTTKPGVTTKSVMHKKQKGNVKESTVVKPGTVVLAVLEPREAPVPIPAASPAVLSPKAGRPSSRLASLTVPSMAQSVASTAAKASYTQTMLSPLIVPPLPFTVKKDPKLANNWKTKPATQLTDAELMAMPDSEYMKDVQMAAFKQKLTILKQDILSNAGETTEHLREDTVVVPDPADRATIEEEHALELRTRDRERKLLKKIEQSIVRIDAGDYGYCDETGEPIGVGRLLARPTATLSLEAQQRRELKQKMFGD
ncbi:MAG: hypothetical protein RL211_2154 [Pseudomonadota bacterium]